MGAAETGNVEDRRKAAIRLGEIVQRQNDGRLQADFAAIERREQLRVNLELFAPFRFWKTPWRDQAIDNEHRPIGGAADTRLCVASRYGLAEPVSGPVADFALHGIKTHDGLRSVPVEIKLLERFGKCQELRITTGEFDRLSRPPVRHIAGDKSFRSEPTRVMTRLPPRATEKNIRSAAEGCLVDRGGELNAKSPVCGGGFPAAGTEDNRYQDGSSSPRDESRAL